MLRGPKISVVIPGYDDKGGIRPALETVLHRVDGVVDNNSADGAGDPPRGPGARVVLERPRKLG